MPASWPNGWLTEAKNQGGEHQPGRRQLFWWNGSAPTRNMLANELEKLLTYQPKITRDNIELLTEKTPQSKVFDLLDAAFSGNKKRALELYADQRAQKVEPQAIMAMMAWQLKLLALAKIGGSREQPANRQRRRHQPISAAKSPEPGSQNR